MILNSKTTFLFNKLNGLLYGQRLFDGIPFYRLSNINLKCRYSRNDDTIEIILKEEIGIFTLEQHFSRLCSDSDLQKDTIIIKNITLEICEHLLHVGHEKKYAYFYLCA